MMLVRFILLLLGMFWSVTKKRVGFQFLVLAGLCLVIVQGDLICLTCPTSEQCSNGFCSASLKWSGTPVAVGVKRDCTPTADCNKTTGTAASGELVLCCNKDNCNPVEDLVNVMSAASGLPCPLGMPLALAVIAIAWVLM
ncbi:lymphocyte antigen 6D-like [Dunckerocampus dactyliophorus]|uniref:lymphocyte antigen 6D-like n=1 Tax=Dunckerocampus dactyliophorus TaxID=161453 RepID=UPI0024057219|nr:lymphocyte antigen 6D-like [Dunckerocampus dactyliophorus]